MPVDDSYVKESLTEAGIDSITEAVTGYVSAGLQDFAFAATDLPNFLADTSPIVAAGQPTRQILRAACRSYARGGGPQNLPGFDGVWGGLCQPYLDSINESPTGGSLEPPFTGGQCAQGYLVWGQIDGTDIQIGGLTPVNMVGPLRPTGRRDVPAPGQPFSDSMRTFFDFDTGSGPASVGVPWRLSFPSSRTYRVDAQGQSDNCGNPPVEYDPPRIKPGLPTLPPTPVDFPGVGPINIDVGFDPQGNLTVNLPDIGVEVPIEVPFDISIGEGGDDGGGPAAPPPGDVGDPGQPQEPGPGGEAAGEAPEGSVLTGVRVQVLGIPNSRNKYTEDVYRGAYYVYMGVPGLLDLDFGGAMVRTDQFFFAELLNLTSWRVSANTGWSIRATPYFRSAE